MALIFVALLVLAAWGGWRLLGGGGSGGGETTGVLTHKVVRGDMLITVTDDGTLESASNLEVKCEIAGGGTILWLVVDGKHVEAGEKLVEFDPATITDQLNLQNSVYERALALKIQSEQNLAAAEIAVREYEEGTYIQSVQTADSAIQIAQQNLSSAENTLGFTEKMVRKGFATPLQLEADRFAVERAQLDLDAANTAKRVLEDFTFEKTMKQLVATKEAAAAQVRADSATLKNEQDHLAHLRHQLTLCVIVAPARGMVVYANDNRSRWGSSDPDIYEGAAVRDRQKVVRLPDLTRMQVKTTVHESKVDQIRPGLRARVVIQGRQYTGHVVNLANQPEASSYFSANVKEYATTVAIDGAPEGLRPGMTAQVEILIAEIKDAIALPVTAVIEKRDGFYCYLKLPKGFEERKLHIGRANDTYIEIQDGVKEGDLVVRNPRAVIPQAREEVPLDDRAADRSQFGEGDAPPPASAPAPGGRQGRPRGERGGQSPQSTQRSSPAQMIAANDKDSDGKLSRDEAPEPMKAFFDQADADQDGFVTAAELTARMSALRNADQGRRGGDKPPAVAEGGP